MFFGCDPQVIAEHAISDRDIVITNSVKQGFEPLATGAARHTGAVSARDSWVPTTKMSISCPSAASRLRD